MAENFSESKHIASLGLDISQIDAQLKSIEDKIRTTGLTLKELVKNDWKLPETQNNNLQKLMQERTTLKSICSLYEQSAHLQKNIRDVKTAENTVFASQVASIREKSENLFKQYQTSGKITDEMREQTAILKEQLQLVQTQTKVNAFDNPVVNNRSMLSEIASKAKWYLAGSAAFAGGYAAKQTIQTLTDVEYKIMEITRVMNDATLDVKSFRTELFDLAVGYGRSFDDVSEVALRFAQAGYSVKDTIALTKDSLLALNTAELDVQNSTESMIGIMQQWGYSADELSTIIDKVNYTADNNAASSQDLVDGLLQASSVAKIANMSFDQTVGVLTAMKEASGRTGKEVGNAFKSILSYIQRPGSLTGFDAMGIDVFANKATGELLPMIDILQNMSNKWNGLSIKMQDTFMQAADDAGLMNEELANSIGIGEEYGNVMTAQAEATSKANNEETRAQADLAAGVYRKNYYISLMENMQKALQVTTDLQYAEGYSMQENGKHMDTLRAKYTSLIGALQNLAVESGDSGFMILSKGALDLATALTDGLANSFMSLPVLVGAATVAVSLFSKQTTAMGIEGTMSWSAITQKVIAYDVAALKAKLTTAALHAGISMGLTLALQGLILIFQNIKSEADLTAEAMQKQAEKIQSISDKIKDLKVSYEELKGITHLTDEQEHKLQLLKDELDVQEKLLKIEKEKEFKAKYSPKEVTETYTDTSLFFPIQKTGTYTIDPLKNLNTSAKMYAENLEQIKKASSTEEYERLNETILFQKKNLIETVKELETYRSVLGELPEGFDELIDQYNELIQQGPEFSDTSSILLLSAQEVKKLSSEVNVLSSAIANVAQGNALSMDEILALIGKYPDLAGAIRFTADGYYIEAKALNEVRRASLEKLAADQLAVAMQNMTANLSAEEQSKLKDLQTELENASTATEKLAASKALLNFMMEHTNNGKEGIDAFKTSIAKARVFMQEAEKSIAGIVKSSGVKPNSTPTKSWAQKQVEDFERLNKMGAYTLEQQIKFYTNLSKAAKATADERKSYEEKVFDLYKKQIQEQVKLAEDAKNKSIKNIQERAQKRIDYIKREAQAEIDAIKDAETARDRSRDKEDYNEKRKDLQTDRSYWEQRTGAEAAEKLVDIDKQIADLDKEWARKREDWNTDDRIKAIERDRDAEIEAIEETRDRRIKSIEQSWKAYEEKFSEANINVMAQAAVFAPQLYQQYYEQYINPLGITTNTAFTNANVTMIANAGGFASEMLGKFQNNLISPLQASLSTIFSRINSAEDRIEAINSNRNKWKFPKSHTGSEIVKDGLVELQAGEIVVRRDVSAELLKYLDKQKALISQAQGTRTIINPALSKELQKAFDSHSVNNTYNSIDHQTNNQSNNDNGKTIVVKGNLFNVEKQEIGSDVDADVVAKKAIRVLNYDISKLH